MSAAPRGGGECAGQDGIAVAPRGAALDRRTQGVPVQLCSQVRVPGRNGGAGWGKVTGGRGSLHKEHSQSSSGEAGWGVFRQKDGNCKGLGLRPGRMSDVGGERRPEEPKSPGELRDAQQE